MTAGNWITVGIFIVGMVTAGVTAYYGFVRNMEVRVSKLENRCENHQGTIDSIATLNQRIEKVANDNETFWRILGPHLANIIHSPKAKTRDALVDELTNGHIDIDGARRLITLLTEAIASDRWNGDKRIAGALLLARAKTKLVHLEAEQTISKKGAA